MAERTFPVRPLGDELYYALVAANLASGLGHVYGRNSLALRPPAQAFALSLFADPGTLLARSPGAGASPSVVLEGLRPLVRFEVLLGTLLVLATAGLGTALFDRRTGLVAGLVAALYPNFVAYSHYLWSETLFSLLVTSALAGLVAAERRRSAALAALSGLAFGMAALARELAIPVAVAGAAFLLVRAPGAARRAAAARAGWLLACAALVVLPWTLRNRAVLGRTVPVSTVGWIAVGEGNALDGWRWLHPASPGRRAFRARVHEIQGEVARADFAQRVTLARIAAEQPGWIFEKLARNLPLLLSPEAGPIYKLRNGSYGEVSAGALGLLTALVVASYVLVFAAAVLGFAAAPGRRLLAGLVLGVVVAVHVTANAVSRFRMPWMPILIVYAAHAALLGRAGLGALSRRARYACTAVLAAFGAIVVSWFWVR